jgi:hypothetical protein
MKKIVLVILFLATGLATFAKQNKNKKKSASGNDIISVTMHRTMCFGRCPDYQIEIDNKGMATYSAIRFNADSGIFKKNIGVAKAKEVLGQFKTYRIDTCKNEYDNRIPDMAGIIYTVKYKTSKKTIYNAHFGPAFLKQLAEVMDAAGKKTDNSWKKIANTAIK